MSLYPHLAYHQGPNHAPIGLEPQWTSVDMRLSSTI